MTTPPGFDFDDDYYGELRRMVRKKLPTGGSLIADLHSAFLQYFADEGLILSPRDKHRLFLKIVEEVLAEMKAAAEQLRP